MKIKDSVLNTNNEDELTDNIYDFALDVAHDIVEAIDNTLFESCNLDINFRDIINFNIKNYV